MRKILVVLIVAAVLVLAFSVPAMAAPEPSHQWAGSVVWWAHYLKGPLAVDTDDSLLGTLNRLGHDVIPTNKTVFAPLDGGKNNGEWLASLAHLK
jgi:hypothetical protein